MVSTLINFWSVKLMTRFTNLISVFKIVLPTLTILMLIISGFHPANFGHSVGTFMPYGSRSIFEAAAVSGIIMSYDAFPIRDYVTHLIESEKITARKVAENTKILDEKN